MEIPKNKKEMLDKAQDEVMRVQNPVFPGTYYRMEKGTTR